MQQTANKRSKIFVLFSGHNDRAVIALCRYFSSSDLSFIIVSSGSDDLIKKTYWSSKVVFFRIDKKLDLALFDTIADLIHGNHGNKAEPVYCPTTEFMNHFVLQNRNKIIDAGWCITLPCEDSYNLVTSKERSQILFKFIPDVKLPTPQVLGDAKAPCVLKPRDNVTEGCVYYPRLCRTDIELEVALKECDEKQWFAQNWIHGQSYYLCAYIKSEGRYTYFWQQNLLQQPGGKSIVFARSVKNPGINTDMILQRIIETGYHGPIMIELIQDNKDDFYYIEINPRFWGPLQLAVDRCPEILHMFVMESGQCGRIENQVAKDCEQREYWYSWQKGAKLIDCHRYPALEDIENKILLDAMIEKWDVYNRFDTQLLHGNY